jgi:hypothetical protein
MGIRVKGVGWEDKIEMGIRVKGVGWEVDRTGSG